MTMLALLDDFADLLTALHAADADFVVVGGYAVSYHGHVRATKDIDILVRPSADNSTKVYEALATFGAPMDAFGISIDDFAGYDGVFQIGVPPCRIDIINKVDGINFGEAVADGDSFELNGIQIPIIGRQALLKNKQASGRPQDLADVHALKALSRNAAS